MSTDTLTYGRPSGLFDDCPISRERAGCWHGGGYAVLVDGVTLNGDPVARLKIVCMYLGDAFAIAKGLVKDDEAGIPRAWCEEWQPDRECHSRVIAGWRRTAAGEVVRDRAAGPTEEELE